MVTGVLLFLFGVTVAPFGAGVARAASARYFWSSAMVSIWHMSLRT